jgi:hypothetical protein
MIGRGRRGLAAAVVTLALVAGCSSDGSSRAHASRTAEGTAGGVEAARGFQPVRNDQPTPIPFRLEIPSIHLTSPLERLGRAADGTAQVPSRWRWPAGMRSARDQAIPGRR